MNIKVEKINIEDQTIYKILEIEKCCDEFINNKNICINDEIPENDENYDYKDPEYSVKIVREGDIESWDYSKKYYEKITFCPFCGKAIIVKIVNKRDRTEEYKSLREERDRLWKRCCETDSKKEEGLLKEQVYELDKKINKILTSDNLKKDK